VTPDRLPDHLRRVFESKKVEDSSGNLRRLDSNVSESEAADLFMTVRRLVPRQSVEIGLAHGISACAILAAILANGYGHHHIIDPFQQNYGNTGTTMICRDLTDQNHKVSIQNRFREIMAQGFSKIPKLHRLLSPNALRPWSVFRTGNLIFLRKLKIDDRDWRFHQRF
jgi:hypothetical protein